MKQILHISFIFAALIFVGACSGSGKMLKRGNELRAAGMNEEAIHYYMESLRRDNENIEALIALREVGQQVVDEAYGEFFRAMRGEDDQQAIRSYRKAEDYRNRLKNYNIDIARPAGHEKDYEIVLDRYVESVYQKARVAMGEEDYKLAQGYLNEVNGLRSGYKDAEELLRIAESKPLYAEAMAAYDRREYRTAYNLLKQIENTHGPFEQSSMYIESALQNGKFGLGIMNFGNHSGTEGIEAILASRITRTLQDKNDPFLKLIDRSMLDALTEEQRRAMTGQSDPNTAVQAGQLLGAKAILVGELVQFSQSEGNKRRSRRTGYLGRNRTRTDREGKRITEMIFEKVYYYDVSQRNEVSATLQFKVVDVETGEILLTDAIALTLHDEVNYSEYNGDTRYLYMGEWEDPGNNSARDKVLRDSGNKRALDNRLRANREIRGIDDLSNELYEQISGRAATEIYNTYLKLN